MFELLLQFGILPAVAAGALLLAGGRRDADVGVGATVAFLLVWLIDNGGVPPTWPPGNSKEALPIGVLLAGIVTLFPGPVGLRRALFLVPAWIGIYYVMSTQRSVAAASIGALLVAAWAVGADTLARRRPGGVLPLVWLVAFALTAGAFERAGNLSAAQYIGGFAAACGAFFVLAGLRQLPIAGAALPFGVGLTVLLLNSHLFAELPMSAAILLFVAPQAAWIGEIPWFRDKPWWLDWGARLGAVVLVAGTALAITAAANAPAEDAPAEESNPYVDAFGDG